MKFKAEVRFEKSRTLIVMSGWIDERSEWPELSEPVGGNLVLDLAGVSLLNSLGVRNWIQWLASLEVERDVVLIHCSPAVVKQINILEGFLNDRTKIETIYVPYFCEDCGFEENKLADIPKGGPVVQEYDCPKCGKRMELDMIESQFLAFMKKQRAKFPV
jgi:hypothetical protein